MNGPWPTIRLGEVLRYVGRPVNVLPDQTYHEIGIRSHGRGIFHKTPVTGLELGTKRVFTVNPGDFVLNIVFAWEGAVGIAGPAESGMIGSHRFPTFRPVEERLDTRFLSAYLRTPPGLDLLGRVSPGGAGRNRTLSRDAFLRQPIALPPLAEQLRIVARIEELAKQIEEARALRREVDVETKLLWERGAARVYDLAVETYPIRPLSELVNIRGGGTPSKADPFYWNGDIPWVSPKDMKVRDIYDAQDHISEQAVHETPAKVIQPGAILVVVRGMILAHTFPSAVLRVPAAINQDMKALIPIENIFPEFLCLMFWAYNSRVLELVERSTHDTRKLETPKLLDTKVVVPPLSEQHRIVVELDAMQAEVDALKRLQSETAAELDALLPSILDRAFRGEL